MIFAMKHDALEEVFVNVVNEAKKAPSVHNIQPVRWHLDAANNVINLSLDGDRKLPVADPHGRDVLLSCGAAAEGTIIALSRHGYSVNEISSLSDGSFSLQVCEGAIPDRHLAAVNMRRTWRGMFDADRSGKIASLQKLHEDEAVFIKGENNLARISHLNDIASLYFFKNKDFLSEMTSWMRFWPSHSSWLKDGLNADDMAMNRGEAICASLLLRPKVFAFLDKVGLGKALVSDEKKIKSSSAVVLFHRPQAESYFDKGRALYRFWLEMTHNGLHACPMAALSDRLDIAKELKDEYGIKADRELVMPFRVGGLQSYTSAYQPRLDTNDLIIN